MFHDSGGDRRQTVAALALLIPKLLRAEGYSFVRLRDMLGLTRAEAEPAAAVARTRARDGVPVGRCAWPSG